MGVCSCMCQHTHIPSLIRPKHVFACFQVYQSLDLEGYPERLITSENKKKITKLINHTWQVVRCRTLEKKMLKISKNFDPDLRQSRDNLVRRVGWKSGLAEMVPRTRRSALQRMFPVYLVFFNNWYIEINK